MKIQIGFVQKPHGIRGEVKVMPTTDFEEERFVVGSKVELELKGETKVYEIETVRKHQGSILLKFKGLDSLNDVEFFHRAKINIDKDDLHELDEDEFYFIDLEGLDVYSDDELVGKVTEVLDMPAHAVLRVNKDILIPFNKEFIKDVNLEEKKIIINYMEGLY